MYEVGSGQGSWPSRRFGETAGPALRGDAPPSPWPAQSVVDRLGRLYGTLPWARRSSGSGRTQLFWVDGVLAARVVFLTNERAYSRAETYLDIVAPTWGSPLPKKGKLPQKRGGVSQKRGTVPPKGEGSPQKGDPSPEKGEGL